MFENQPRSVRIRIGLKKYMYGVLNKNKTNIEFKIACFYGNNNYC